MIAIGIAVVVLLVGLIGGAVTRWQVGGWQVVVTAGLVCLVGFGAAGSALNTKRKDMPMPSGVYALKCVNDTSELHGKWYLFGGYLDGRACMRAYVQREHGWRLMTFEPRDCYTVEDGRTELVVKSEKDVDYLWGWGSYETFSHYEFHIPQGSIANDFTLDAQ